MAWIPGGVFRMGSDRHYPEEGPAHRLRVSGFWMDRTPVTNRRFAAFVRATGYRTVAEQVPDPALYPGADPGMLQPGSLVFRAPGRTGGHGWHFVPGASWHRPQGEGEIGDDLLDHPVVQVAHADAAAYAAWAGKSLPTEAEWEFAARGGLEGQEYAWGDEFAPGGRRMARTWMGNFPVISAGPDAYGTAAVGGYPANGYGLVDMIGNVWEWTEDFWTARHPAEAAKPCCIPADPRAGDEEASLDGHQPGIRIPRRVLKGGSHLCAPNHCRRYRPAARHPQMVDSATTHVGFRCVRREAPAGGRG
ncbi:formylglycine-generating enzyme family protein [Roseomonas nepalensis]|uniref:Formylglycine-generating enzyme family protein n=1 Tax=Muricoccus nepalensis TaxID=1854500 RepID=A0A502G9J8_9PROT|nr:formylglycine-generating enzyme family protein [Roseomonas nepalensis]TPG58628.1 formylglycine-generating enzyme family protein [Roseomonas nepalensis]